MTATMIRARKLKRRRMGPRAVISAFRFHLSKWEPGWMRKIIIKTINRPKPLNSRARKPRGKN